MKKMREQETGLNLKHYSIFNNALYFVKYFKKEEPLLLWLCLLEILLGAIIPMIGIYLPKIVLNLLTDGITIKRLMLFLGSASIIMMLLYGSARAAENGKFDLYNTQRRRFIGLLFLKSLRIRYKDTELGEGQKAYWRALNVLRNGDSSSICRMVTCTVSLLTNCLCFVLYSSVLSTLNMWVVVLLISISMIDYGIGLRKIQLLEKLRNAEAEAVKHGNCVNASIDNQKAAKDIRIFSMTKWLSELREQVMEEERQAHLQSNRVEARYEKISLSITVIRDIAAYAFLIYMTVEGRISVSDFVLYLGAVAGFSSFIQSTMREIGRIRDASISTDYVRAYMDLPDEQSGNEYNGVINFKYPVEIEFKDVSFRYEEEGELILSNLNLKIKAGEKIALVGANGAGKTTFVKLLCGMYEPECGSILINGVDQKNLARKDLYKLFSIVFQEKLILPFTVGENLAMDVAEKIDREKAWNVLEEAGLKKVFEEQGISLESYMTKIAVSDGVELSGGQEQRFLMARALYKDAPIMIMDEPTAALDPIAESEIYESYNEYTTDKTAIFISHRLASTRFSDRIIYLENGAIMEMGSHDELLRLNGKYAEMFRVQSQYYQ